MESFARSSHKWSSESSFESHHSTIEPVRCGHGLIYIASHGHSLGNLILIRVIKITWHTMTVPVDGTVMG